MQVNLSGSTSTADPSSCLEEVRFPDFHIAQDLLNQVTPIELTPDKPGLIPSRAA